ncbi:MAG: methyltransferase domain-containing protein [Ktedonobacteraceae bacterium]|nr:methyltransferase domain-containing protein [Ktedonobacteraceae bacterium]
MSTREEPRENTYMVSTESGAEMARLIDQDLAITNTMGLFPKDLELHEGDQILDVACGPGGWARNVATQYPHAEVVGVDISQTMISYANAYVQAQKMGNIDFQIMDVTKPWSFADASFDIVNGRTMVGFLNEGKWQHVIAEMLRVLVPGGTIILTEPDDTGHTTSPAFESFTRHLFSAAKLNGLSHHPFGYHFGLTPKLGYFLKEAGCEQIQQEAHVIDFSTGAPAHRAIVDDLKVGYKLVQAYIVRNKVVTQEEIDNIYERLLDEWESPEFRALWYFLRIWGKKPA